MVKHTRIAGMLFLVKGCHAGGKLATGLMFLKIFDVMSKECMTHKGTVNYRILFCFKANTAFCTHQNFGAADSLHTYLSQSIRPNVQDDDNHPYEFKIAYFGRTGKMLWRPSSVSGVTLNHPVLPVPKFLSAPVNILGQNHGPLRVQHQVAAKDSRFKL